MTEANIREILNQVAQGQLSVAQGLVRLRHLPFADLGFAKVDLHRKLRRGIPEVVFGERKSVEQIAAIGRQVVKAGQNLIVTRLDAPKARALARKLKSFEYRAQAQVGIVRIHPQPPTGHGTVMVLSAGTSDIPVAEEAAVCAEMFGNRVSRLYDVGVAGLHRLTDSLDDLAAASVLIVVAGMEGALPSVVAGLIDKPVVAVPTSIGYGVALGGIAPLLGMLNACSGGVVVVNIDNGFGAAMAATLINRVGLNRSEPDGGR
ncbi:MAG TPA: nickel pincer cofactor biosynthesis protein LarB [Candidatus Binataceae bacterium]|jgi:NCAIR mutase (PurE)-related protein|nr:nickel pincer cofactor biosynthesis protein LarB [Candidatus Binataceae bacterium]